ARPNPFFGFSRTRYRGGGKVENLFLVFNFPRAFVAGAGGMGESRQPSAGFPRGSWKEREGCLWLSALSTAPAFPRLFATSVTEGATGQDLKLRRVRCRLRSARPL